MLIAPITITSPSYFALVVLLVFSALTLGGRFFAQCLTFTGAVVAVSWLDGPKAAVMLSVLIPNLLIVRTAWGRPDGAAGWLVLSGIIWQALVLCLSKINTFSGSWGVTGVVGLSYLTFRAIQLLIEAPRARSPFSTVLWASYLINPLTLIAGPVQTWRSHCSGIAELGRPGFDDFLRAAHLIVGGYLKVMVIAPVFAGHHKLTHLAEPGVTAADWTLAFYSYYAFLFFDFSGYIDVVRGIALTCGFRTFPENFRRPYLATNFQDFWGRWNITLGQWFRSYVFNPILAFLMRTGGSARHELWVALSLLVTFFLIGLWHGIAWNFVVFGVIQAVGVCSSYLLRQWAVRRFGRQAVGAYEAAKAGRVIRIILFQHAIAASFMLLDNDMNAIISLLTERHDGQL